MSSPRAILTFLVQTVAKEAIERRQMIARFCKARFLDGHKDLLKAELLKIAYQCLGTKGSDAMMS